MKKRKNSITTTNLQVIFIVWHFARHIKSRSHRLLVGRVPWISRRQTRCVQQMFFFLCFIQLCVCSFIRFWVWDSKYFSGLCICFLSFFLLYVLVRKLHFLLGHTLRLHVKQFVSTGCDKHSIEITGTRHTVWWSGKVLLTATVKKKTHFPFFYLFHNKNQRRNRKHRNDKTWNLVSVPQISFEMNARYTVGHKRNIIAVCLYASTLRQSDPK